jgi:hypothetical protein
MILLVYFPIREMRFMGVLIIVEQSIFHLHVFFNARVPQELLFDVLGVKFNGRCA